MNFFVEIVSNDSKAAADFQKEALAGAGEKFLVANAKKPGVKVLPSGLQYKVITEGHGEVPKASDEVVDGEIALAGIKRLADIG